MWCIMTEADLARLKESQAREWERIVAEARKKAETRADWEKLHPPCPTCGHKEPLPIWLQ